jgi:hypothetical protein
MRERVAGTIASVAFTVVVPTVVQSMIPTIAPAIGWPIIGTSVCIGLAALLWGFAPHHLKDWRTKMGPVIVMAIGLVVFAGGSAWYYFAHAKPNDGSGGTPMQGTDMSGGPINITNNQGIVTNNQSGGTNTVNNIGPRQRTLAPGVAQALEVDLRSAGPHKIDIMSVMGDTESFQFASEISHVFAGAGWDNGGGNGVSQGMFNGPMRGLLISIGPEPRRALNTAIQLDAMPPAAAIVIGIFQRHGVQLGGNFDNNKTDPNAFSLIVGSNPL